MNVTKLKPLEIERNSGIYEKQEVVLQSHLLLLVYKIVTGHHHKVLPPSQTSRHRHVLLLQKNANTLTLFTWAQNTPGNKIKLYPKILYFNSILTASL